MPSEFKFKFELPLTVTIEGEQHEVTPSVSVITMITHKLEFLQT